MQRFFIGRGDAGELRQQAGPRLAVQPLGIALLAHRKRAAAPDFDEAGKRNQGTRPFAIDARAGLVAIAGRTSATIDHGCGSHAAGFEAPFVIVLAR